MLLPTTPLLYQLLLLLCISSGLSSLNVKTEHKNPNCGVLKFFTCRCSLLDPIAPLQ